MKYGDVTIRRAKDRRSVEPERERGRESWTERGVRSLLGTTLALGRVITRFVSRKPSGSTQMRARSSYREYRTFLLVTALFLQQTDDSFFLSFLLSTARPLSCNRSLCYLSKLMQ